MPPTPTHVIHFTFHAYATWMPDRPEGYFQNKSGLQPRDLEDHARYRARQRREAAEFTTPIQKHLIERLMEASKHQRWTLFAVGTDPNHLHFLTCWSDDRSPEQVQRGIKQSLSLMLIRCFERRRWFTRNGHDRRVRDAQHFVHLRDEYLPSHPGWGWERRVGWRPPRRPNETVARRATAT